MKVFVYGTLKRGHGNNVLLRDAVFLGEAWTVPSYIMIGAGFPVLLETNSGHARTVRGELYEFESEGILADLDSLEGEGRMYNRHTIGVRRENGDHDTAFVYIGHPDFWKGRGVQDETYVNPQGELEWRR